MKQLFNLKPQGIIESGSLEIDFNYDTGVIDYDFTVVLGLLFFNQTKQFTGVYKVPPEDLKSENLKTRMTFQVGIFSLTIVSIDGGIANGSFSIIGNNVEEQGTIAFNILEPTVSIISASSKGQAQGYEIDIDLIPIP